MDYSVLSSVVRVWRGPEWRQTQMKIMDFRCPSCRGTDWLSIRRGQRHLVQCQSCGQVRLLLVRPLPPTKRSTLPHLFPAADALEGEAGSERR